MINIECSYMTLPYNGPVPVRGAIISENRFLKVSLQSVDYFISVLPGLHEATLEEIAFKIKYFFSNYSLNFSNINFSEKFFNLTPTDTFLHNIQNETLFNIEVLLLGMIQKTHPKLFKNTVINKNELYRSERGARAYEKSRCLKIKITPESVVETIRLIKDLHQLNPDLILRLDGNRKFELSDIIAFQKLLKNNISTESFEKIDYIEEPFKNFSDIFIFQKRAELKIAMDESFSNYIKNGHAHFPQEIPVVIKPSLFGISSTYKWMLKHSQNRVIISSCFEHPSISFGLIFLATERAKEYHGLESFL